MKVKICKFAISAVIASLLSGCASMKLPDMDFIKFPEFKEEANNIPDYPKVEDAPELPKKLRSDKQWDKVANNVIAKRESFTDPALVDAHTDTEVIREINKLHQKIDEYKKDDPK